MLEDLDKVESYLIDGTIVLNRNMYQPRMNWRFCHELAHVLLDHQSVVHISEEMEMETEALAGELMMPPVQFRKDMSKYSIPELKVKYPHVSWEALLKRYVNETQTVLTIIDNNKVTQRIGSPGVNFPKQISTEEWQDASRSIQSKSHVRESINSSKCRMEVSAYYVDDNPEIIRVLLIVDTSELP